LRLKKESVHWNWFIIATDKQQKNKTHQTTKYFVKCSHSGEYEDESLLEYSIVQLR
jgi:hypothetical protein